MNYGTLIIILAILDVLVIFSGLPTGWKKCIVLVISLVLILIGWVLRTMTQRRKMKLHAAAEKIEHEAIQVEQVAREIAHDVEAEVEHDLHELTNHHSHDHE